MKIQGRIESVKGPIQVSESFSKVEVIIRTIGDYPQVYCVEFGTKNIAQTQNYQSGMMAEITAFLNGREWTNHQGETKYILSLNGTRIDPLQQQQQAPAQSQYQQPAQGQYHQPNQYPSQQGNPFEQPQHGQPASPAQAFPPNPNPNDPFKR